MQFSEENIFDKTIYWKSLWIAFKDKYSNYIHIVAETSLRNDKCLWNSYTHLVFKCTTYKIKKIENI